MAPRFADLATSLALATDLGTGRKLGTSLQRCLNAMAEGEDRGKVYYSMLLSDLGCTSVATDRARRPGDDFGPLAGRQARSWSAAQTEVADRLAKRLGLEGLERSNIPDHDRRQPERDPKELRQDVLSADPLPDRQVDDPQAALEVVADFADLKSPFLLGHSRRVARLVAAAAERAGVGDEAENLRFAGLVHDVGRVGVSSWVWNKAETLEAAEMEEVRLHPAHTETLLQDSDWLGPIAALACTHHECLNGDGYHRGAAAEQLSPAARLLAAADDFSALTEPRPHRPAMDREQAERVLAHFVESGCLDGDSVSAVLATVEAGLALESAVAGPDAELVRLAARGNTTGEIAKQLDRDRRTVKRELASIRELMGVKSQPALAVAALEQGLLP